MRITKLIIALCLMFASGSQILASHVLGSEIYYEHVKDSTYDFYVKIYRDCSAAKFTMSNGAVSMRCFYGGWRADLDLTRVYVREITTKCDTAKSECRPLDSIRSGNGIEEHLFKSRVDFGSSKYKSLATCGPLTVRLKLSNRSSRITTGPGGTVHCNYVEAELYQHKTNSSPNFNNIPVTRLNANQPISLDFSASDVDGDSLSYHLAPALDDFYTQAGYYSKFSAQSPVTYYDPTGRGAVSPYARPPWGLYFDNHTGRMIFTAVKTGEVPVIVVEVKEWRKGVSGKYQHIGSIFREITVFINGYSNNIHPHIRNGKTEYFLCEGDSLSILLNSVDTRSAGQKTPDTTSFYWRKSINGASLTNIIDTTSSRSALFTWATKFGDARKDPYRATFTVSDGSCPLPGAFSKTFLIHVASVRKASIRKTTHACHIHDLIAEVETYPTKPSYVWRIYDTTGTRVKDPDQIYFNNKLDSTKTDSVRVYVRSAGTYVISLEVVNEGCTTFLLDTIQFNGYPDFILPKTQNVCSNFTHTQEIDSSDLKLLESWKWYWKGDSSISKTFDITGFTGKAPLKLVAYGTDGCMRSDSTTIVGLSKPVLVPIADTTHCSKSAIRFNAKQQIGQTDSATYTWSNGTSDTATIISSSGNYWLKSTNICGNDSVGFQVIIDSIFDIFLGKDALMCDTNSVTIGLTKRPETKYLWNTGDTTSSIEITSNGTYIMTLTTPCMVDNDTIEVAFDKTPEKLSWMEYILYCDTVDDFYNAENDGFEYLWDDGSTNQSKYINRPGWHKVTVLSNHCGQVSDSTYAVLVESPDVDLGNDTSVLAPVMVELDAGDHTNASYLWNTGDTTRRITVTNFGMYSVKVTNVCGDDSASISVLDKLNVPNLGKYETTVFPNPSSGTFTIKSIRQPANLMILDVQGRNIPYTVNRLNGQRTYSIKNPLSGYYIILIQMDGQNFATSLVIE